MVERRGGKLTSSPSMYGRFRRFARKSATEDFPQPAGPVMIQMCRSRVSCFGID